MKAPLLICDENSLLPFAFSDIYDRIETLNPHSIKAKCLMPKVVNILRDKLIE